MTECAHAIVSRIFSTCRKRQSTISDTMASARSSEDEMHSADEEKLLIPEEHQTASKTETPPLNIRLWLSIGVNTLATVAIVGTLKKTSLTTLTTSRSSRTNVSSSTKLYDTSKSPSQPSTSSSHSPFCTSYQDQVSTCSKPSGSTRYKSCR